MKNEKSVTVKLNLKLINEFPELKRRYLEETEWQEGDETGSHVVYGDVFTPFIEECINNREINKLIKICNFIEDLLTMNIEYVTVHVEIEKEIKSIIKTIKGKGYKAGLAINPDTPISFVTDEMISNMDYILFMSVYPGFYGRPFVPEVLDKIKAFKALNQRVIIGIDGGVKLANVRDVADAGAEEICVGSAVFAQPDKAKAFSELTEKAFGDR